MQHPSGGLVQKSTFARFLEFFDFRLFQQYRPNRDISQPKTAHSTLHRMVFPDVEFGFGQRYSVEIF
jgi:hypothetical protein